MQREPIYNALLTELQQLTPSVAGEVNGLVQVVSRGFVMWDSADQQPAIYIVPRTETAKYTRGTPTMWTIRVDLYVYVRWQDQVAQGVSSLSTILDAIDAILSPVGVNASPQASSIVNTLGGLVHYCAIQGSIEISGGFLNTQQCVARVPVEMVAAG